MSSSLSITKSLDAENKWQVIATVVPGSTLPFDIFAYLNTGQSTLGEYYGVCNLSEYQRCKTFAGTAIPIFANKFVKFTQAKIQVDNEEDADSVIQNIVDTTKILSASLTAAASSTVIYNIP